MLIGARAAAPQTTSPTSSTSPLAGYDLSVLRRANPRLDEILAEKPGVALRLAKIAADGAIAKPAANETKTQVSFGMWTHSKRSGGMANEPFKDVIFVWQSDPNGTTSIDLQRIQPKGKLIGVFQLDQLAYRNEKEAKRAGGSMETREFAPGKFAHVSTDGGWEWERMRVYGNGKAGDKLDIQWAIVEVSPNGDIPGGGFPGGWKGRSFTGVHGQNGSTST